MSNDGGSARAGWYPDPSYPAQFRWWDGSAWTSATKSEAAQRHWLVDLSDPRTLALGESLIAGLAASFAIAGAVRGESVSAWWWPAAIATVGFGHAAFTMWSFRRRRSDGDGLEVVAATPHAVPVGTIDTADTWANKLAIGLSTLAGWSVAAGLALTIYLDERTKSSGLAMAAGGGVAILLINSAGSLVARKRWPVPEANRYVWLSGIARQLLVSGAYLRARADEAGWKQRPVLIAAWAPYWLLLGFWLFLFVYAPISIIRSL